MRIAQALTRAALEGGWEDGLNLIQDICGNARYFTDSATKIPLDVAQGDAAAGMCIDFYGRTYNELLRKPDGSSRVEFVIPERGTSMGVDPIAMFRGANREASQLFIEFVLSRRGRSSGTTAWARQVARSEPPCAACRCARTCTRSEHLQFFSDPDALPFEKGEQFRVYGRLDWPGLRLDAFHRPGDVSRHPSRAAGDLGAAQPHRVSQACHRELPQRQTGRLRICPHQYPHRPSAARSR